jgi:alkylation response protein AidB-like acyl-CoA dehydrogenase
MSDLLYSEIESDLRSGVRELLADRCAWPDVLAWSERGGDLGLWSALAAQDLMGLSTLTLVPTVRVEGGLLTGTVTSVADALTADALLVPVEGALYVVDAADVSRTAVTTLDLTRPLCDLALSAVPGRLIADDDGPLRHALTIGAAMLASEQLGVAEQCLESTLAYVKTRHQFGRPVGSYQGLKHRLADLWVSITQARAVARHAADCVSTADPETAVAVAVAQAHCSVVVVRAAEECVQMHGGIGFTWEHPAHLYLKRAKSTSLALGGAHAHRAALAELVDLPS